MSEISFSERSGFFTSTETFSSFSSTIPGIGALSGKAFKRFGSAVVNGVDAILIRRRLAQIETTLGQQTDVITNTTNLKPFYSDLLELSRPMYSLSIRTRAFRLIMGKIGAMDVEDLAAAVASWPLSESYDLLKAVILSLRLAQRDLVSDLINTRGIDKSARLDAYCAAGLDAYKSHLTYTPFEQTSRMSLCTAFLLYMGLTISLSKSPAFSRLAIELDLLTFITDIYPGIVESKYPSLKHLLPARMVVSALLEKLDPAKDAASIVQLQELLAINLMFNRAPFYPITSKGYLLSSIRSSLIYLRSPINEKWYAQQILYAKNITYAEALSLGSEESDTQNCILLLGSEESGKTTLKKQMIKAHRTFTHSERANYIDPIVGNILLAFCPADRAVPALVELSWEGKEVAQYSANAFRPFISSELADLQSGIVSESSLLFHQQKLSLHYYYTDYFLNSQPRILSKGYLPSDEDIVRCYIRTTGIHTETINIKGNSMALLDVGGERSERRNWIDAFQKAKVGTIVFFVASLSDYNEVLHEDETVNRMQESLTLFESIINSSWFEDVPVVLFLNKMDLFAQKLRNNIHLKDYFPDYSGGDDYNAGCGFIIDKFLERSRRPSGGRDTRVYLTSFIDDGQIKNIMNEIYDAYLDPLQSLTTESATPSKLEVHISTTE